MSKHVRIIIALLITLTSFSGVGTLASASQTGSSDAFTSELNGSVVEIADTSEGEFQHEYHWVGDTGDGYDQEVIIIGHGYSDVYVAFVRGDVNPQQWNEDSFAVLPLENRNYSWVLGAEADDEQSWFLSRDSNFLDIDQHMYNEFLMDIGNGQIASVWVRANTEDLIPTIQWTQQNVTIDGHSVFTNADLGEIQAMLDGTSAFEPYELEGLTLDVDHWSGKGLISANEWQSPEFGHSVTWDDSTRWEFPFYHDVAIQFLPEYDAYRFVLERDDHSAFSWFSIHETDHTAAETEDLWTSEEWLAGRGLDYPALAATSTLSQVGVIAVHTSILGDLIVNIRQYVLLPDGTLLHMNLHATPEEIVPAYLDLTSIIEVNGESIDQLWTQAELEKIFPNSGLANDSDSSTGVTRSSRSSQNESATATTGESVTGELTGVTIDLGSSGEATFNHDAYFTTDTGGVKLDSFTFYRGNTVVIIDVMDGDVDVDSYMLNAEQDIAATYDYTDWLDGEWSDTHSWDIYSGAYKLDYREIAYLDLEYDADSNLYYGTGVYDSADNLPASMEWLQNNVTINGEGILASADTSLIEVTVSGDSEFEAEAVPVPVSTVDDWASVGLVSETEWHDPYTGTIFTWDGENLVFPFAQHDAIVASGSEADGSALIELRTSDRRGEVKIYAVEIDLTPEEIVDSMISNYTSQSDPDGVATVTVLDSYATADSGSVILLHYTDFGHPVVLIVDAYVSPEGLVIVSEISAAPGDIADVYGFVWDSVQANGDFYPLTWSIEDIEALDLD